MATLEQGATPRAGGIARAAASATTWLPLTPYLLVLAAIWGLLFRYWGIQHDALAYMLQIVARLKPDPLAGDIFLRFTSQEEFTLFPALCAPLVAWLGVDTTGALLTFAALIVWLIVAWRLLHHLHGNRLAWLALGLLVAVPGWYSAGEVFRYAEPFLTARTATEVLSLAALLACLKRRWVWAAALLGVGAFLHPLMAFPAFLIAFALALPLTTPSRWNLLFTGLVLLPIAGSFVLGAPAPFIDGDWLSITHSRSGFLFADTWEARDREVFATTLLTLAMAVRVLPPPHAAMRRIALAALCVGAAGLVLAIIASEWVPLKVLLQGQSWRWLWVGRVMSIAVIPLLVATLWTAGRTGRAAAALLCSAWLLTDAGSTRDIQPIGMSGLLCALAWLVWEVRGRITESSFGSVQGAAMGVLVVTGGYLLSIILNVAQHDFSFGTDPVWVQRAYELVRTPGIAMLIVTTIWWTTLNRWQPLSAVALATLAFALTVASLPETLDSWTRQPLGTKARNEFAPWRASIPTESEVLWDDAPQAAWFLLDRRSYLTVAQGAGTVFSREIATEIQRRANSLAALVSPGSWVLDPASRGAELRPLSASILRSICEDEALGFVVSRVDIGAGAPRAEWPAKADFVYLYDCRLYRDPGST
jgi:hypothetical protein